MQICSVNASPVTFFLVFTIVITVFTSCHTADQRVLSPQASLKALEVEDGFEVDLVAAEPLVIAPVAMAFDEKGRIWVVEMDGYMADTLGIGENAPVGRVAILTDHDGDGKMDERTVFLDSLVMPRAI